MFELSVMARIERIDYIERRIDDSNPKRTHRFFEYQNRHHELPLISLPIDLPIYRMDNNRTLTRQHTFIKQNEKNSDFFSAGQENEEVQQVQNDILLTFAKKGIEGSITPIIDVLKTDFQKEPLILTYDGVVVNGNRRLSAMRYLYSEINKQDFEYVECAILPKNATEDEIKDIEARLQNQPETKLGYGWIIDAMVARDVMERKGIDKAPDLLKISPTAIKEKVFSLQLVDEYLARWLEDAENYDVVEDGEQWFSDLAKKIKSKDVGEKEITKTIAYLLAEKSVLLEGRLYNYNNAIGKFLPEIAKKLASKKEVSLEVIEDNPDSLFSGSELGATFSYDPLIKAIEEIHSEGNDEDIENLVFDIRDIYEETKEKNDDKSKGEYAKNNIAKAHTILRSINISEANPSTYNIIQSQLAAIEVLVQSLRTDLNKLI